MITLCTLFLLPFAGGSPEGGFPPLAAPEGRDRDFWKRSEDASERPTRLVDVAHRSSAR